MTKKLIILTSLLGIFVIFLSLSCCKDCPDCPTDPEPPPLGHYRIYAYARDSRFLMSVDTPVDTIVDSVRLNFDMGYGVYVTPDGRRVMVTNTDDNTMEIYNASDLSYLGASDQYGDYYFDATDNYGVWTSPTRKRVYFISADNLIPYDSIDCSVDYGYLDTVSNTFFAGNGDIDSAGTAVNRHMIFVIDCNLRILIDTVVVWPDSSEMGVIQLAYDWLTEDLYFHARFRGLPYFFQYDTNADSIVKATATSYPLGSVSVSPDGSLVYMTDSGDGFYFVWPPGYVYIFDALSHEVKDIIPPYVVPGGRIWPPLFGQIVLTPDNRRAYVSSNLNAANSVPLVTVDLLEGKIINAILPYEGFFAVSIAMGPAPE
jgi:DNA-binding beta-propeller fold protein YncE